MAVAPAVSILTSLFPRLALAAATLWAAVMARRGLAETFSRRLADTRDAPLAIRPQLISSLHEESLPHLTSTEAVEVAREMDVDPVASLSQINLAVSTALGHAQTALAQAIAELHFELDTAIALGNPDRARDIAIRIALLEGLSPEEAARQGQEAARIAQAAAPPALAEFNLEGVLDQIRRGVFPTFRDEDHLNAWATVVQLLRDLDRLTDQESDAAIRHSGRELARFRGWGPPAVPAPAVPAVAAPPVALPAPSVTIPGLEALPDILKGLPEVLGGALRGVLTTALPTALSAAASKWGLETHRGRLGSLPTTASALVDLFLTNLAPVGLALALHSPLGAREMVRENFARFLGQMLDRDRLPQPLTTGIGEPLADQARAAAADLVLDRILFGLQAHAVAKDAELAAPLKSLGLGQWAAFLADLAGFQRLATALVTPLEDAAIRQPMLLDANRRFRTRIPDLTTAAFFYAKKEIIPTELATLLELHGLPEAWKDIYREAMFMDPRLTEIVRLGQFFNPALVPDLATPTPRAQKWLLERFLPFVNPDERPLFERRIATPDWFYIWAAAKGGYDPSMVLMVAETARRAIARREQTLFLESVSRLYRDGAIDDTRLEELTREAWELSDPISARVRATQLRALEEDLEDIREVTLAQVARGIITPGRARDRLLRLGFRRDKVDLHLARTRLGLLPRLRLEALPRDAILDEGEVVP